MIPNKILIIAVAAIAVSAAAGLTAYYLIQNQEYPIEYELDGGEFCIEPARTYKSGSTVELQFPVKDGKAFAGWYTDADKTEYFDGKTSGLKGPLKLYARWAPSSVGYTIWFDVEGDCVSGLSSYTVEGSRSVYYDIQSTRSGLLHTATFEMMKYSYYEIGTEYVKYPQIVEWGPGLGNWAYNGSETIATSDGEKLCEKYVHTYDDGATETRWIDENGIVYKEYYEYLADSDSDVSSKHITRTHNHHEYKILTEDYSVDLYCGLGITVTGNKETYKPGELVELTAETASGVTFGGWYDKNMSLLCSEYTYTFEVGMSQQVYALNSVDIIHHYQEGDAINLSQDLGLPEHTWFRALLIGNTSGDSWDTPTYSGLECGSYLIQIKTPAGEKLACLLQVGGTVTREFTWDWGGKNHTVSLEIGYDDYVYAKDLYQYEERRQSRPDHERDRTYVSWACEDAKMSPYTVKLTDSLIEEYTSKHGTVTVSGYLNYLLAFVQNIPYQSDEDYLDCTEYWKFPLETLFDKGGDCEDTAILFAALAVESREKLNLSYDVALQILPGHLCAAIKTSSISGSANPQGYLYGETTAKNYAIGEIPTKMKDYFLDSSYYPKKSFTVPV